MRGHIKLGSSINDLRDYLLVNDAKIRQRTLANPMAAKLGQGAGKYDDLTNWSGWVMENWQAGLGKREADAEGFLYAELETRFQGQLCLPTLPTMEWTGYTSGGYTKVENKFDKFSEEIELGSSKAIRKLAMKFTQSNAGAATVESILLFTTGFTGSAASSSLSFAIYTDTGGNPDAGTLIYQSSIQINDDDRQVSTQFAPGTGASLPAGNYWIIIIGGATPTLIPTYNNSTTSNARKQYDGAAWADSVYSFPYHITVTTSYPYTVGGRYACLFGGDPHFYRYDGSGNLFKYSSGTVSRVTTLSAQAVAVCAWGGVLALGYSGARGIDLWNGTAITNQAGVYADLFCAWNGYLWRGYQNNVWYTADGTTWTGPIQIGPSGEYITGLAGLGQDMYASTNESLSRIGMGDQVQGVMRYNNISSYNGRGMINHQGVLIIPTHSDLLRYGGAEIMSITPNKDEGLPSGKQGRVLALASHNYWLFALVEPPLESAQTVIYPMILAYNDQGWHFFGKLPRLSTGGDYNISMVWDTKNNMLWAAHTKALFRYPLPIDHQNIYKDQSGSIKFFPWGTMETPWFYSGLKEIRKDCESVYVTGENITSARPVKVYWKDDDSTDWEYLGTVTSNRQELRWSDPATRPNTRQIKLGIVMTTDDYTQSPRIDAIRLKYQNMVQDRWRWQLSVSVSDDQEMLDGELNIYTKERQRTHLEALAKSVSPILFEDVDGTQYEVKVLGATEQVERYEYTEQQPNYTSVFSFTVEQTTTTTYN